LQCQQRLLPQKGHGVGHQEFQLLKETISNQKKVAQRIMFIKENLGILHKYDVSLAKGNKTEDQQYLIKMEMMHLPLLGEDDGDDIDVGQNNE
jgi:hypothetical protein